MRRRTENMPRASIRRSFMPLLLGVPTLAAALWSNATFLNHQALDLLSLSVIGFMVGSVLFGMLWVAAHSFFQTPIVRELAVAAVGIAWLYIAFDVALSSAEDLRSSALLAAYAIATAWWVMQLIPRFAEPSALRWIVPSLVAACTVTAMVWIEVPLELTLLPAGAVLALAACQNMKQVKEPDPGT